jgi:hypothetical protein
MAFFREAMVGGNTGDAGIKKPPGFAASAVCGGSFLQVRAYLSAADGENQK